MHNEVSISKQNEIDCAIRILLVDEMDLKSLDSVLIKKLRDDSSVIITKQIENASDNSNSKAFNGILNRYTWTVRKNNANVDNQLTVSHN